MRTERGEGDVEGAGGHNVLAVGGQMSVRQAGGQAGELRSSPSSCGRHCGGFIRQRQRDDILLLL